MINVTIDRRQLEQLKRELGKDIPKRLTRETSIAINATAKKSQTTINRQVREELVVTAGSVKKAIKIQRKSSPANLSATVTLKKEDRLPLRDFKPRQVKRGTSYRISKRTGRRTARSAFMHSTWGGHVYARRGAARMPIHMLHGASPWGAYHKQGMRRITNKEVKAELFKQVGRRIRFLRLKRTGVI